MTQEEKQQLWECICEMVPHDTIVHHLKVNADYKLNGVLNNTLPITGKKEQLIYLKTLNDDFQMIPTGPKDVRPYLRPMSSMTEEELKELNDKYGNIAYFFMQDPPYYYGLQAQHEDIGSIEISEFSKIYDWLNAHHFDYRCLIEKGLALEAPEDMYKVKRQ